nr:hypothetical protein [uncultured Aminipila sp.]
MKIILTGEEYKALETKANRAASDRKELVDFQKYIKDQLEGNLLENAECEKYCTADGSCDECELQPFIVSNEKEAVVILQNIAAKVL